MGVLTRYRATTAAGVIAALVLVLVFGSPPYGDWARDNANGTGALDWFLTLLTWPSWDFDADLPVRDIVAIALRAILVIVLTAVFLALLTGPRLSRERSGAAQLLTGWSAYIFAGAGAGLLAAIFMSDPSTLGAFQAAAAGAAYGLFTGWVVGLATFGGPGRMT
ncbi:hypothetical protein E1262_04240 [Jiangella aurantiaca]|uniref:Uncharacterized protein n=1 Tax=Jiangella aurantiaca TaxID=2530373 RepID=A0A4R5ALL9_9ACTN|nr:hypothetical protein [Jiangella aurantiaca]TDD71944.1 hypothetical protein E1262_04240 [Jiangella aurantiaca]